MCNSKARGGLIVALALLAVVAWAAPAAAACTGGTCFVVNAGGNSSATATWSIDATSAHVTCTCTPATTDNVVLDGSSGNLTINASLSIGTLDASGTGGTGVAYTGTITQAAAATLTINTAAANSLKFVAGMFYTPNTNAATAVIFANTTGTAQVTSAGKNFTAITMNGVNGTAQQLDDITVTNAASPATTPMTITNGTWDANTHAITATGIGANNANTRGLTLGGLVTVGGGSATAGLIAWNMATTGTFNFTKNAANIAVAPTSNSVQSLTFAGAGLTYNGLTLNANTGSNQTLIFTGSNTFSSITVGSGWNLNGGTAATTQTVGASGFTVNGTQANPVLLFQSSGTTSLTISSPSGTCTTTWAAIYAVTATGGCTFNATNSFGYGFTTGWTITNPSIGGGGGFIGIIGG
jgi:hypothetical protein